MSALCLSDFPGNRKEVWTCHGQYGIVVNTQHITRNDCLLLENLPKTPGLQVYPEGFILTLDVFNLTSEFSHAFHSMVGILRQEKGIIYLRLDADGTEFDDLDSFNWDNHYTNDK